MKPERRMISAQLIATAAEAADKMMAEDPDLALRWLDQNRTSKASREAGGIIEMITDHDWPLAFFLWLNDIPLKRMDD